MANIVDIEGIGPSYVAKLADASVKTTEKLLDLAAGKTGRRILSEKTGINEALLLEWVNRADLFRLKGVGEEYSDLLEAAGVDSPAELAHRNADNLHAALVELNDSKKLVHRVPSLSELKKFIDEAKVLPKIVTH